MGTESAKVGQGKAFKAGWIKKDKDVLKANVINPFGSHAWYLLSPYRQTR